MLRAREARPRGPVKSGRSASGRLRLCPAALAAPLVIAAGLLPACTAERAQARAEAALLRRQAASLRELIAAADAGTLFPPDQLAIGVGEALVRTALQTRLPVETVIAEAFRVRLERADVAFGGGQSLVTLEGQVSPVHSPDSFAELTLLGGLHRFELDSRRSSLTARVELDRFEVRRVSTGSVERGLLDSLTESVGGQGLGALGEVVPGIEIPVRLDHSIEFGGFRDETVSIPAARLPLRVAVPRAVPLSGRLWVMVEMSVAPRRAPVRPAGARE